MDMGRAPLVVAGAISVVAVSSIGSQVYLLSTSDLDMATAPELTVWGVSNLLVFALAPLWGLLVDRLGVRRVLLGSLACSLLGAIAQASASLPVGGPGFSVTSLLLVEAAIGAVLVAVLTLVVTTVSAVGSRVAAVAGVFATLAVPAPVAIPARLSTLGPVDGWMPLVPGVAAAVVAATVVFASVSGDQPRRSAVAADVSGIPIRLIAATVVLLVVVAAVEVAVPLRTAMIEARVAYPSSAPTVVYVAAGMVVAAVGLTWRLHPSAALRVGAPLVLLAAVLAVSDPAPNVTVVFGLLGAGGLAAASTFLVGVAGDPARGGTGVRIGFGHILTTVIAWAAITVTPIAPLDIVLIAAAGVSTVVAIVAWRSA